VNGTAVFGADYDMAASPIVIPAGLNSAQVLVTPINDSEREASETVTVTLSPSPDYSVSPSARSATVTIVDDDNILPVVTITSPADNSRFGLPTNIVITANATDSDGPITRVEFYFDGTNKIGEALGMPYQTGWSNPPAGAHTITAVGIDDVGGSGVSSAVRVTFAAPGFADMFAERGLLGGFTNFVTGANTSYTKEPGEPRHNHNGSGNGTKSAWLSWVAPVSGTVTMNTIGSSFDTVLVVYTNNPPNVQTVTNLLKVASNDDLNSSTLQSQVTFPCRAGVAYQIAVDGFNSSASGTIVFRMSMPNPTPVIVTQPQSQIANVGATVTFGVTANSGTPMTYQWRLNNVDVPNATNSTLVLTNVQQAHAGSYTVVIQNSAGQVVSASASLTLRFPPTIVTPLSDAVVNVGSNVVFSVAVNGTTPFTFQWRFNGTIIPGVSGGTLGRNNIQYTNGGIYSVTVANAAGSVSSQAELIVRPRLLLTSSPTNGGFVVRFLGTPGKAYDVQRSTNLVDWSDAGGVTNQAVQAELLDTPGADSRRMYRLRVRP
jgi:beta-galactosidase